MLDFHTFTVRGEGLEKGPVAVAHVVHGIHHGFELNLIAVFVDKLEAAAQVAP